MRVLLVNNHYGGVGGAETVVGQTEALLRAAGHDPVVFAADTRPGADSPWRGPWPAPAGVHARHPLRNAVETVYWPSARRHLAAFIAEARPDVAHVHHIFDRLTPRSSTRSVSCPPS